MFKRLFINVGLYVYVYVGGTGRLARRDVFHPAGLYENVSTHFTREICKEHIVPAKRDQVFRGHSH